jgi:hypothetical protein
MASERKFGEAARKVLVGLSTGRSLSTRYRASTDLPQPGSAEGAGLSLQPVLKCLLQEPYACVVIPAQVAFTHTTRTRLE